MMNKYFPWLSPEYKDWYLFRYPNLNKNKGVYNYNKWQKQN